ncbi:uncharacterized protein H6S33_003858 [Morchella sextelata]|uniref:uncharacterized protein n=1 Tax=Morchella sextelata TaxID=1174677 RepID=UPI001D052122|nr:uncharacterized protein H6S33_003858 [Morchella sextelata]KAH0606197.1 hypothetical protein H6S33_003858 [Morchella sextelata]
MKHPPHRLKPHLGPRASLEGWECGFAPKILSPPPGKPICGGAGRGRIDDGRFILVEHNNNQQSKWDRIRSKQILQKWEFRLRDILLVPLHYYM